MNLCEWCMVWMINDKWQNIILCKILHITYSSLWFLWSFHLKYVLNLRKQDVTLQKSFKALVFFQAKRSMKTIPPHSNFWNYFLFKVNYQNKLVFYSSLCWSWKGFHRVRQGFCTNFLGSTGYCWANGHMAPPPLCTLHTI